MYFVRCDETVKDEETLKDSVDMLKDDFDYLLETISKLDRSGKTSYAFEVTSDVIDKINAVILDAIEEIQ